MKKKLSGESPTNGAKNIIDQSCPYQVSITLEGSSDFLFHRWNCEAVEEKSRAAKGSAAKKSDDLETFVYRDEKGFLSIPGEYIRGAIIHAAKFKQDPRSPRKSAMDLFKAGVVSLTNLASTGIKDWDYIDKRRVVIQKSAITRSRPALNKGWKCEFIICVLVPEYIDQFLLQEVIGIAGRLIGIGDFRPTFGRFNVIKFEMI